MRRSTTIQVDFERLRRKGPEAAVVVRLMMACNDMSLANQSLAAWKSEERPSHAWRRPGACMYFVRTQFGHLREGLKVINSIRGNKILSGLVQQCDQQTRESFSNLLELLPGNRLHQEFSEICGEVRNELTFHYNESGDLINRAIDELASKTQGHISTITRASTAHAWYFKVADAVVDNVVCHELWNIPRDVPDVQAAADEKASRCHEFFLWFVDFSGEFIWQYCRS